MSRGGGLHPDWWPPIKRHRATPGGLIAASVTCLSGREGVPPCLRHIPSFGRNPRGSPDFLAYPVPKACIYVLGTGVPRRLGVASSASSPKAAQALGCSLTPGLLISFGQVTSIAQATSVPGLWTLGFLLFFGVWFGSGLCLGSGFGNPANPGWGLGWVCLGTGCSFAPPFPAGGLWCMRLGLCVDLHPTILGWDFGACVVVCALHLYHAVPGSGVPCRCVCLGSGFGCAPPLLAEVLGCVCVCVRDPPGPLPLLAGVAVWVCVLGLRLQPRPATPGWGVRACVCLCARPACTPPLLAGVCGVGVCPWARVSAVPRHSWLGRWGVCVFVRVRRFYPAIPGGVVCVCLGLGFVCSLVFSWLGSWGVLAHANCTPFWKRRT